MAEIVSVIEKSPRPAGFTDIAVELKPMPRARNLHRWLHQLVAEKRLVQHGKTRGVRYGLPAKVVAETPAVSGRAVCDAVRQLVSLPLAERTPVEYRRALLDVHCPNETYYLSVDASARVIGKVRHAAWREKADFDRMVAELAVTILALENAVDPSSAVAAGALVTAVGVRPLPSLTADQLVDWLAESPRPGARADVQLAWAIRSALVDLANRNPKPVVSPALLAELYAGLASRVPGRVARGQSGSLAAVKPGAPPGTVPAVPLVLRTSSLQLSETAYAPLADRVQIQVCFQQMLQLAGAITSPTDQAFFLLLHLLYLLPFPTLNATMALLAMNASLVFAGLSPLTLSGVTRDEFLTALRGVWELNRPELLAEVFAGRKP